MQRRAHVRHGVELLILDCDKFSRILGERPVARDYGRYRLTLPAYPINRDCMLRRRLEALQMRQYTNPRRDNFGQFVSGYDGDHTGHSLGSRRLDCNYSGVRMWGAYVYYVS